MIPAENSRREIKFVADELQQDRLIQWLRLHPEGFRPAHPARWINSIYFDTYDYTAFKQNLTGASSRSKVRYRWYGPTPEPAPGVLEIKCKRNYFGWKLRYRVDRLESTGARHWRDLMRELDSQLPPLGRIWLASHPQPTLLGRYFRHYFETEDGRVRATVDTGQSVFDQRYKPYLNIARESNICRTVVLELKFHRRERERAARLVEGLPARVSRNSKYILGLRALHSF